MGTRTVYQTERESYEMVAAFYILLDILTVRYLEYTDKVRKKMAVEEVMGDEN